MDVGGRVLVLGLGVTGRAVATVLAKRGARVYVSDAGEVPDAELADLRDLGVETETDGHDGASARIGEFDFVVPSPGISPHRGFLAEVLRRGVRPVAELDLAASLTSSPIVAVTGTNGKTTVCTLAEEIGRAAGLRTFRCGNTENPFIATAAEHPDADLFVVEASSFGLYFCETFHPRVAVVTNLVPDHLDWHTTFADYRDAKSRIAANLTAGDLFVYPVDQPQLADLATMSERIGFEAPEGDEMVVRIGEQEVRARGVDRLAERGRHFAADAVAAATALVFCGAGGAAIEQALASFAFAPHRLELIGVRDGVRVIDDSVSTNPHATIAALRSLSMQNLVGAKRIVLIAGGRNKGLDLSPLGPEIGGVKAVVTIGEAADEIARIAADAGVTAKTVGSMSEAVGVAFDWAVPGDVVLLSPACASHDMFDNYADRGRAFREAGRALGVRE